MSLINMYGLLVIFGAEQLGKSNFVKVFFPLFSLDIFFISLFLVVR